MTHLRAVLLTAAMAASAALASSHDGAARFDGEVRRVDKEAKKITIRHGAMPSLDMPAHTMVFQVKDPVLLERVKAGDKVKFRAEKVAGAFFLVSIERAE